MIRLVSCYFLDCIVMALDLCRWDGRICAWVGEHGAFGLGKDTHFDLLVTWVSGHDMNCIDT